MIKNEVIKLCEDDFYYTITKDDRACDNEFECEVEHISMVTKCRGCDFEINKQLTYKNLSDVQKQIFDLIGDPKDRDW